MVKSCVGAWSPNLDKAMNECKKAISLVMDLITKCEKARNCGEYDAGEPSTNEKASMRMNKRSPL